MRTEDIIRLIKESKKKTPCTAFISGDLEGFRADGVVFVGGRDFGILSGDRAEIEKNPRGECPEDTVGPHGNIGQELRCSTGGPHEI